MSALCAHLDAFFDDRLSGRERAAFRDHLATCQRCQSELHQLMQLAELAETLALDPDHEPAAMDDDSDPVTIPICRVRRSRTRLHQAGAIAAAAAVILGLCLWRGGADPAPPPPPRDVGAAAATAIQLEPAHTGDEPDGQAHLVMSSRSDDLRHRCSLLERALAEIHAELSTVAETMLATEVGRASAQARRHLETWLVAGLVHAARLRGQLVLACAHAGELELRSPGHVCEPMQTCLHDQAPQRTGRSAWPI